MMGPGVTASRPSSLMFFMWKGIGVWAVLWVFAGARPHRRRTSRSTVGPRGRHLRQRRRVERACSEGYVNAILHPDILGAIKGMLPRRRHLHGMGGLYQQKLVDWHLIEDEASARVFRSLRKSRSPSAGRRLAAPSRLRAAALRGQRLLGVRQVIDLSGDGRNNEGEKMPAARGGHRAGVTVNGSGIINDRPGPSAIRLSGPRPLLH